MTTTSTTSRRQQQQHRGASFDKERGETSHLNVQPDHNAAVAAARTLMKTVLSLHNLRHHGSDDPMRHMSLGLIQGMVRRCRELDHHQRSSNKDKKNHAGKQHGSPRKKNNDFETQLVLTPTTTADYYTPLHWAVYHRDFGRILFLLRTAMNPEAITTTVYQGDQRMMRRPMDVLYCDQHSSSSSFANSSGGSTSHHHHPLQMVGGLPSNNKSSGISNTASSTSSMSMLQQMTSALDAEGMTAADLLAALQTRELSKCRHSLLGADHNVEVVLNGREPSRVRSNSWIDELNPDDAAATDEQNEFDLLYRAMRIQTLRIQPGGDDTTATASTQEDHSEDGKAGEKAKATFGCEVCTFGRAHHCALGVVVGHQQQQGGDRKHQDQQLRPQRVQAFAQDVVGRKGSAVAIASATHHTLTVTSAGALYAFGLGKGGRLGTGDEKPCATPVRVQGPLMRQRVVAAAAAENHSLCVTASGHVYAFGSNRFGQLGISSSGSSSSNESSSAMSLRCSPRRVDDLKRVFAIDVAAGAKHSVALSSRGEVYVWGDNGAGQLGISGRTSSNSLYKPQRVEALCKGSHGPKKVIAIAASEASTLVLTPGAAQTRNVLVNMVYAWGHGSHVPCKVQFPRRSHGRPVNPIAISSARYHNVAVTSVGEVYSWGLHADSLGTHGRRESHSTLLSAPQLVAGMLPENGGGRAVAVSASENHTAVVTDEGHLYTWGDTYSKNVMGHEGVRWQPSPKRVRSVHRAVAVSAAKEHSALLIGVSFPPLPPAPRLCGGTSLTSLEDVAARKIAGHVDLFNSIPTLIMAERTQSPLLLQYCKDFVQRNLDGVLNVGQKSVMDRYLNEQLLGCPLQATDHNRDCPYHPLATDVVLAGSDHNLSFHQDRLCSFDSWTKACESLAGDPTISSIVSYHRVSNACGQEEKANDEQSNRRRSRAISCSEASVGSATAEKQRARAESFCSYRCDALVSNMDLSTKELAQAKLACLSKESRAIRKRLGQISRLESGDGDRISLTPDQQRKLERRPQLEADLKKVDPAIALVENMLLKFQNIQFEQEVKAEIETEKSKKSCDSVKSAEAKADSEAQESSVTPPATLRCDICCITCPDTNSYQLHLSGRKHRNRLNQVEEEQKKDAAAQMIEEQQRQLLLGTSRGEPAAKPQVKQNPWNKSPSVQPKYKLPPPPHPLQEFVGSPPSRSSCSKKSLREIMAEESSHKEIKAKQTPVKQPPLKLPPGTAPMISSPPWASAKMSINVPAVKLPWSAPVAETRPKDSPYSVDGFLRTPEPDSSWSSPDAIASAQEAASVSFRDIQQQEAAFKERQDHAYGSDGKWFIERRERAGSFKEIQSEAIQAEEHQRLVEEQIQIEKQIYEEIAAEKGAGDQRNKKRNDKKQNKSKGKKGQKSRKSNAADKPKQENSAGSEKAAKARKSGPKRSRHQKSKQKTGQSAPVASMP